MTNYDVLKLRPHDADRYTQLRRRMLTGAPWAFASGVDNDRGLDTEGMRTSLATDRYAVFAVEQGDNLVAAVGLMGSHRPKHAHRASIWGMWVDVKHRGRGLSKRILRSAILEAWSWDVDWIDLGVSERALGARQLYDTHGFTEWGRQPEALDVDGARYDESYMTLRTPGAPEARLRALVYETQGYPDESALLSSLERFIPSVLSGTAANAPTLDGFADAKFGVTDDCLRVEANAYLLPSGSAPVKVELWHDNGWLQRGSVSIGEAAASFPPSA